MNSSARSWCSNMPSCRLMEATGKLHGGRVPPACATTQEYFRDVYDHLARINATIDAMRDTITTAILVCQSTVSIEQNEVNKRLAAWAGIFAVATAFAGIWGMNFQHMPELSWEFGYPLALIVITATCGIIYITVSSVPAGCNAVKRQHPAESISGTPVVKSCLAPAVRNSSERFLCVLAVVVVPVRR